VKKNFLLAVGLSLLSMGCGKVSTSPIAPILDPSVVYNFDTGLQGWAMNGTAYTGWSVTHSTVKTFRDSAGSMRLDMVLNQSNADNNKMSVEVSPSSGQNDLTGKLASVWVYWASGFSGADVRCQLYIKAPGKKDNYGWANGNEATLQQGCWTQATIDFSNPSFKDSGQFPTMADYVAGLTHITTMGLQVYTHNGVLSSDPGVIYVDNYGY